MESGVERAERGAAAAAGYLSEGADPRSWIRGLSCLLLLSVAAVMLCRRLRGADERPPHEYYASCLISTKYRVVLCATRVERAAVAAAGQQGQQCQTRGLVWRTDFENQLYEPVWQRKGDMLRIFKEVSISDCRGCSEGLGAFRFFFKQQQQKIPPKRFDIFPP